MVKEIQTKNNFIFTVEEIDVSEHVRRVPEFYRQFNVLETRHPSGRTLTSASCMSCYAL